MGRCLAQPSHYLNQCWFLIREVRVAFTSAQFHSNTTNLFVEFENYTLIILFKFTATSPIKCCSVVHCGDEAVCCNKQIRGSGIWFDVDLDCGRCFDPESNRHSIQSMRTSSNGNIVRVTGHLCGEFIGHRWIPRTKTSDAELWCFLWSAPWINGWGSNSEAGDLRRHRAHYDATVKHVSL